MNEFTRFFIVDNFIWELLFSTIPLFPLYKKKRFWWLYSIICAAVLVATSHLTFALAHEVNDWVACSWYVSMAFLTIVGLKLSFDNDFWECCFFGASAYMIQHLFFKCKRTSNWFFLHFEIRSVPLEYVAYWSILFLVMFLCYLFYTKKIQNVNNYKVNNLKMLFVAISIIVVEVVISFFIEMAMFRYRVHDTEINLLVLFLGIIFAILMLETLYSGVYNRKKDDEVELIHKLWKQDRKQYELSKQNIDTLNIKYHDLKYQINTVLAEETEGKRKALKEAIKSLNVYDSMLKTGNDTLDVLLTEKRLKCDELNIPVSCIIQGELLDKMEPVDIYSLFGNALDNAIECLEKVENKDVAFINVIVKKVKSFVRIDIENYAPYEDAEKTTFFKSTKENENLHGFGLKSINHVAKKYNGEMSASVKDHVFKLEILIMP